MPEIKGFTTKDPDKLKEVTSTIFKPVPPEANQPPEEDDSPTSRIKPKQTQG